MGSIVYITVAIIYSFAGLQRERVYFFINEISNLCNLETTRFCKTHQEQLRRLSLAEFYEICFLKAVWLTGVEETPETPL